MKSVFIKSLIATAVLASGAALAQQTVKIAYIDGLSGMMGPVGQNQVKSFAEVMERANAKGKEWAPGYNFKLDTFDNKTSPQETLTILKTVIDQGYRYVAQGNSSGVGMALQDAINKHNERNPGKELFYINYAAIDPDMTNSKCTFTHFRFDANVDQKMEALTSFMRDEKKIKSVYLLNQNYSFGHQVAKAAKEMLGRKRPDVKIAGEDLHPIAQVKDFAPYVAKIKASGADSVITGNWGSDMALLIKAAKEANLNVNFYTYYAGTTGVPTAMGASGEGKVFSVSYWHPNEPKFKGQDIVESMKKKTNDDFYTLATYNSIRVLADSINKAKTVDPIKVAFAMEGMKSMGLNGEVEMRAADHQLQQPLVISVWTKTDGKAVKYDQENTGYGWKTISFQPSFVGVQPHSCDMKRPKV